MSELRDRVLYVNESLLNFNSERDIAQDPLDGQYKPASLSEFPGNRHRSAIIFCAKQPTGLALAIVASQDGDVSLFGRTGGGNHVVPVRACGSGTRRPGSR